jgi:uncharacterized protein
MMSIYKVASFETIKRGWFNKIESIAIHYDWNLAFEGKSRGNMHLIRTVNLVKYLWERVQESNEPDAESASNRELDIAVAGALLHDIGLVEGNIDHCRNGKIIAENFLRDIGIPEDLLTAILHCIETHDGEIPAFTLEAKLVHDADTIDKLGPLGVIRHIWKLCLLGEPDLDSDKLLKIVPNHLDFRFNKLYLDESRDLASSFQAAQQKLFSETKSFEKLVSFIKKAADKGLYVDKMLPGLFEEFELDTVVKNVILKQINLEFIED